MTGRVIWGIMKALNEIGVLESSSSIFAPELSLLALRHCGLSANPRARHNIN